MLAILQRWLAVKLGLLVTLALAAGFALAATVAARAMLQSSARLYRESAGSLAASIGASIRMTMMAGDGMHVRRVAGEIRRRLPRVGIRVFAADGDEVFADKPAPPTSSLVPAYVRAVLASGTTTSFGDLRAVPIVRDSRCTACHADGPVLGVLSITPVPQATQRRSPTGARTDASDVARDALGVVVRDGFYRMMLAPSPHLDEYFAALPVHVPEVRGAGVLGPGRTLAYGTKVARDGTSFVHVTTFSSDARCLGCHDSAAALDSSTLVVAFDNRAGVQRESMVRLVGAVLEEVMSAGLGRLSIGFLQDVARAGQVRTLTLHDAQGRLVYDAFASRAPPADVDSVLRSGRPRATLDVLGTDFRFIEPLDNDKACQSCHGNDRPIRGAIEIRLNTGEERVAMRRLQRATAISGSLTLVLVLALLALGLYYTVIRPVRAIESVADLVGDGHLDQTVDVQTYDEMGRLGTHVNAMVKGLRQKLELAKFVSRDTLHEVEASTGTIARGGERQCIAVVFSDIRGFTPFSESHEPEAVVAMLNKYLNAQATAVVRHGGDIDKFVGDEIMARFTGPGMALRATRAALDMVAAVEALNAADATTPCHIGVGVNVGDAILGAMGAEQRMDFTAIGDTVNIGARLCSAAGPGEVLITDAVRRQLPDTPVMMLTALAPMHLKGKHDAVAVYRVTARGDTV